MSKTVNVLNGNYEPISYSKNYVEQIILEKDKEIERLNNINNQQTSDIQVLMYEKENLERLVAKKDNIINELERILFSNKMYGEKVFEKSGLSAEEFKQQHPYTLGSYDNSVNLLDKLKELKEGK